MQVETQDWMSPPQQQTVTAYRGVFVTVFVVGGMIGLYVCKGALRSLFTSSVSFDGDDQVSELPTLAPIALTA